MDRRAVLSLLGAGIGALGGCSTSGESDADPGLSETGTETRPETETTRERLDTIYVDDSNGAAGNLGTSDDPLDSIQGAFERARPGQTVYVRPGVYQEYVSPPRGGAPGAPITITGPPEAILRNDPDRYGMLAVRHSHIKVTGLTFDGLSDPGAPQDADSYTEGEPIIVRPHTDTSDYLQNIVLAPHRIGNSQKGLINIDRTMNASVGPFTVTGIAGAEYLLTGQRGHIGEIVYLGTAPSNLGTDWHPWTEYDQTRNVRVHHVDNSAGHPHAELVNTKLGTHDITVEYCTDGGGSQIQEEYPAASLRLGSYRTTVRWCDLRDGMGDGIVIGAPHAKGARQNTAYPSETIRLAATNNRIFGNRISGFDGDPIVFPNVHDWDDQDLICGNFDPESPVENVTRDCEKDVPTGIGIGHTGGAP